MFCFETFSISFVFLGAIKDAHLQCLKNWQLAQFVWGQINKSLVLWLELLLLKMLSTFLLFCGARGGNLDFEGFHCTGWV